MILANSFSTPVFLIDSTFEMMNGYNNSKLQPTDQSRSYHKINGS